MALSSLSRSIAGKVALITGAASGMGKATAELFAEQGASVAVTDINPELEEVVSGIRREGANAHAWALDVTDAVAIRETVQAVVDRWGGLDIVVNNAGVSAGRPIDEEDYEESMDKSYRHDVDCPHANY